jgi:hypothetical protein
VYSSAAVWRDRVYAGSYSKTFYCFDAATGKALWKFKANGPISGSPTVISGRVYFATLKRRTYALDARTGGLVWSYPDGKYSPVVADADHVFLVGYARIYGLVERRATAKPKHLVTAAALRRALHGSKGVGARRFGSAAAASKAGGIQVCNVVLRRRAHSSPQTFWHVVNAVRKACRG